MYVNLMSVMFLLMCVFYERCKIIIIHTQISLTFHQWQIVCHLTSYCMALQSANILDDRGSMKVWTIIIIAL